MPIPAPSHQGRLFISPGRVIVIVAAVASTFPLLILPVGAQLPLQSRLVLAGPHCFFYWLPLQRFTMSIALMWFLAGGRRSWPPPNPTTEPSIELEPKRFRDGLNGFFDVSREDRGSVGFAHLSS